MLTIQLPDSVSHRMENTGDLKHTDEGEGGQTATLFSSGANPPVVGREVALESRGLVGKAEQGAAGVEDLLHPDAARPKLVHALPDDRQDALRGRPLRAGHLQLVLQEETRLWLLAGSKGTYEDGLFLFNCSYNVSTAVQGNFSQLQIQADDDPSPVSPPPELAPELRQLARTNPMALSTFFLVCCFYQCIYGQYMKLFSI